MDTATAPANEFPAAGAARALWRTCIGHLRRCTCGIGPLAF